jgi:prephenate dehydrogenase
LLAIIRIMPNSLFQKVAIIGPGLVGGSIGMAILKRHLADEVIGIGRNAQSLAAAKKVGAVTSTTTDLAAGVAGSDLIVVCTPVDSIAEQVLAVASNVSSAAKPVLITDAGSTKAKIVSELDQHQHESIWPANVRFIGSHPIAGNEKRGAEHGSPDLFVGRTVIVTPTELSAADDLEQIKQFWLALEANVVSLSPEEHDIAMAAVSHVPHLLASAIAGQTPERYVSLSGAGWQDTTRIAAGDATLWRQILLANRTNVLAHLDRFEQQLAEFRAALETGEAERLEQLLTEAKRIRDTL